MGIVYNADEIYEIGVEIERNGEQFYRAGAELTDDADVKRLLTDLANWETSHIELFSDLKEHLPTGFEEDPDFDRDEQKHAYLKAAADSHVFSRNANVQRLVERAGSPVDILKAALGFEKDSVVLYTSMKSMVPEKLGRDKIDRLIGEEMEHMRMVQERIAILEGTE
jgi:rubrerythrin